MSDNQRPFPGAPDDPDRTEQLPAGAPQETRAAPQDESMRPEPLLTQPVATVAAPAATEQVTPAPAAPAPVTPAPVTPVTEPRRGPRVGAVVWGLVVVVLGIGILVSIAGFRIDTGLAAILVLGAAGLALVVGSLVTSLRRRP